MGTVWSSQGQVQTESTESGSSNDLPVSSIGDRDMTGDQLALHSSERVSVVTRHGRVVGGRVKNGVQVFLNVPYGEDVGRWEDPKPLSPKYSYEGREYITDGLYACPPDVNIPYDTENQRDAVGLGKPTESPFFADIYIPSKHKFGVHPPNLPVRVFIHGGFLQGGSTSGFTHNQQFFACEEDNEVRVLLGYRLGAIGFLGAGHPDIKSNYGFKDVWLGLSWIQDNISAFGGDPTNVHISGQSAGAHLVHHLLHHAARQAPQKAPFVTATLYSNSLLEDPPWTYERDPQFQELCRVSGIDPTSPRALYRLRDRSTLSMERLFAGVTSMGTHNTFWPSLGSDGWITPGGMEYQRDGSLARDLLKAGVKCVIVGDVLDEDATYKNSHECRSKQELFEDLCRFRRPETACKILACYPPLPKNTTREQLQQRLGDCLADTQVRLPVRLLARDLMGGGMPVIRYAIEMVAKNLHSNGLVEHGSDLVIHWYRLSILTSSEAIIAKEFRRIIQGLTNNALANDRTFKQSKESEVLALEKDGQLSWRQDWRWEKLRVLEKAIRP